MRRPPIRLVGWLPGMTEVLPAYAHTLAKDTMNAVKSVTIYMGDSGEWSDSGMRDIVWYLRKFGRQRPKYKHNQNWVRAKLSQVVVERDVGSPISRGLFSLTGPTSVTSTCAW